MKKYSLLLPLIIVLLLSACSGTNTTEEAAAQENDTPRLTENYSDALSVQEQLIVGTLNLEETDMAVDETEAQTLLPLWRALQSLQNSDTTAAAELTAVINQIQDNMTPEQITAIAEMQLTADDIQTALQNAGGAFAFRGVNSDGANATTDGGNGSEFRGGGPPDGIVIAPGGGPPGDGAFGGGPGGFGGNADPNAIETRRAQFESGDFGANTGNFLINPLITLLEVRAGEREAPVPGEGGFFRGGLMGQVMDEVTAETGLTIEEIQAQQADGKSLSEIIEANGGDVEAIKATLMDSLSDTQLPEGQSLEDILNNIFG